MNPPTPPPRYATDPLIAHFELILTIELKNKTACDDNDIKRRVFQLTGVSVLADTLVIFFSSFVILTANGNI